MSHLQYKGFAKEKKKSFAIEGRRRFRRNLRLQGTVPAEKGGASLFWRREGFEDFEKKKTSKGGH